MFDLPERITLRGDGSEKLAEAVTGLDHLSMLLVAATRHGMELKDEDDAIRWAAEQLHGYASMARRLLTEAAHEQFTGVSARPIFVISDTIHGVAAKMAAWDAEPVADDVVATTWAEMSALTQAAAKTTARDLSELKAKARALKAANIGALREGDDPEQNDVEALVWSLVRDIEAMA